MYFFPAIAAHAKLNIQQGEEISQIYFDDLNLEILDVKQKLQKLQKPSVRRKVQ